MPDFFFNMDIKDEVARDNFDQIQVKSKINLLDKFEGKLITVSGSGAVSVISSHGLGFIPTDIITLKQNNTTFVWDWDSFDSDTLTYSCTGSYDCRFLVGRFI